MLIRLLFISFLFLLSCNNNESKNSGGAKDVLPNFKEDIKSAAFSAQPLTPQLKERVSQFFKAADNESSYVNVIFNDYRNEKVRTQVLKEMNEERTSHVTDIKKNCIIKTWPISQESFSGPSSSKERSILANDNSKCPLVYLEKRQVVNSTNIAKTGVITGKKSEEIKSETVIMSKSIKKYVPFESIKTHAIQESEFDNLTVSSDGKHVAGIVYTTLKGNTEIISSIDNAIITETKYIEIIMGPHATKVQGLVTIKFPEGDFYYYSELTGKHFSDQSGRETQYFINGEPYTKEQLNKELNLVVE